DMKNKLLLMLVFLPAFLLAQYVPIGTWGDNLPYRNGIAVAYDKTGKTVYAASESSVFRYIKETEELNRINTIFGISATNISTIEYDNNNRQLLIAYKDGNFDVLTQDDEVINFPFIRTSSIIGDKIIHKISIYNEKAYLACGFGIVVFNLNKREITESYLYGPSGSNINTYDVCENDSALFAASQNGLYYVLKNTSNIADFSNWKKVNFFGNKKIKNCVSLNGNLLVHYDDADYGEDTIYVNSGSGWNYFYPQSEQLTVMNITINNNKIMIAHDGYFDVFRPDLSLEEHIFQYNDGVIPAPREVVQDEENIYWAADYFKGMEKVINNWNVETIAPNGPFSKDCWQVDAINENVWVVSGGLDNTMANLYNKNGINYFKNYEWDWINSYKGNIADSLYDFVAVAINPSDVSEVFVGSFGGGLLHFKNQELQTIYDVNNSTLKNTFGVRIGGLTFDKSGNLWVVNSNADYGLHVLTAEGEWYGFNLSPFTSSLKPATQIIVDDYDNKWIILPKDGKIILFNERGTFNDISDDKKLLLDGNTGSGAIPGTEIFSINIDQDNQVWIGTDEGVAVFYNNYDMFEDFQDAQQIFIQQDDLTQILLETESVSAIGIDGANRKWFGTKNSGVYVMSEDATQEIHHFYKDNSPIYSNNIYDIAANYKTGEIYIATDEGLITYKSDATAPTNNYDSIYVYPNPVREDYDGLIAIRGLLRNSNVKITDISGNLIYETTSLGGQAIWDGKDLSGNKVKTGIYLIFCNSIDGKVRKSSKIMVIN
ncbi:MAG TPA: hypothetical protein DIU39_04585, partial [Flavobacteriales bacterium]|nr:hypothetical protein [Flavobacteriales bacterium]